MAVARSLLPPRRRFCPAPSPEPTPAQRARDCRGLSRIGRVPALPRGGARRSGRTRCTSSMTKPVAAGAGRRRLRGRHALRGSRPRLHLRPKGRQALHDRRRRRQARRDVHGRLHAGREALPGLSLDAAGRPHLRAAGVLARREPALGRLEGDHAHSRRRARPPADLERQLLQLPRAPTSCRATTSTTKRYNSTWTEMGIGCEACHGPGPRARGADGRRGRRTPRSKPAYDNSAKNRQLSDILKISVDAQLGDAAPRLRHLRLLPRQQDQRLRRVQGRRSLRRLRAAVPAERRRFPRTISRASSGPTAGPIASTGRRR